MTLLNADSNNFMTTKVEATNLLKADSYNFQTTKVEAKNLLKADSRLQKGELRNL